jgi:hypothetical protein
VLWNNRPHAHVYPAISSVMTVKPAGLAARPSCGGKCGRGWRPPPLILLIDPQANAVRNALPRGFCR